MHIPLGTGYKYRLQGEKRYRLHRAVPLQLGHYTSNQPCTPGRWWHPHFRPYGSPVSTPRGPVSDRDRQILRDSWCRSPDSPESKCRLGRVLGAHCCWGIESQGGSLCSSLPGRVSTGVLRTCWQLDSVRDCYTDCQQGREDIGLPSLLHWYGTQGRK